MLLRLNLCLCGGSGRQRGVVSDAVSCLGNLTGEDFLTGWDGDVCWRTLGPLLLLLPLSFCCTPYKKDPSHQHEVEEGRGGQGLWDGHLPASRPPPMETLVQIAVAVNVPEVACLRHGPTAGAWQSLVWPLPGMKGAELWCTSPGRLRACWVHSHGGGAAGSSGGWIGSYSP